MWYLDSGCCKHTTKDQCIFSSLESHKGGSIIFGKNGKWKIVGKGIVTKSQTIENVYLVEGLKHNLLSICQLCDVKKRVIFVSSMCKFIYGKNNEVLFCGDWKINVYIINTCDLDNSKLECLSTIEDQVNYDIKGLVISTKSFSSTWCLINKWIDFKKLQTKNFHHVVFVNKESKIMCLTSRIQMCTSQCLEHLNLDLVGPMKKRA